MLNVTIYRTRHLYCATKISQILNFIFTQYFSPIWGLFQVQGDNYIYYRQPLSLFNLRSAISFKFLLEWATSMVAIETMISPVKGSKFNLKVQELEKFKSNNICTSEVKNKG